MKKKDEVIKTINKMLKLCKPISYGVFNKKIKAIDIKKLRKEEKKNDKLGICDFDKLTEGVSTLSIIATITDILCGKRLAFIIDNNDLKKINNAKLTGVCWSK